MTQIIISYELFQKLIAHLQTAVYELGEQTESLSDQEKREELNQFMDRADELVERALQESRQIR